MRRFIVDTVANFTFFVPFVTLLSGFVIPFFTGGAMWSLSNIASYLIASVFIATALGRGFTLYLEKVVYPLSEGFLDGE